MTDKKCAKKKVPSVKRLDSFVALDFETAEGKRDSACAVAIVTVKKGKITDSFFKLIRPPRKNFANSRINHIVWSDVLHQPTFAETWPLIRRLLRRGQFVATHGAHFERSVLHACCSKAGIEHPPLRFVCTVQLAREVWKIRPTKLPDVCGHLGIPLQHHRALSDAQACARIVMAAMKRGADPSLFQLQ